MKNKLLAIILIYISSSVNAQSMQIISSDFKAYGTLKDEQRSNMPGCNGKNISPQLSWNYIPNSAKSLAITAYDPDAPTGSGLWHWIVYDINISTMSLSKGASNTLNMPKGSVEINNSYGIKGYIGACPPSGAGKHRYIFTLYALDVEKLPVTLGSTSAVTRINIIKHTVAKTTITAYAQTK